MPDFDSGHGGSIPSSRTGGNAMSVPVDISNYLRAHYQTKDVNVSLTLQGRTLFYIAKWMPLSKKHRLLCVENLIPGNPVLRLAPRNKASVGVYTLHNV